MTKRLALAGMAYVSSIGLKPWPTRRRRWARLLTPFLVDVADRDAVERLAEEVHDRLSMSLLINNAGVGAGADALSAPDAWSRVSGVNFLGVINGVQAFVPGMVTSDRLGMVINTAPSRVSPSRRETRPTMSARRQ